jgi:predicted enzyme related to lactoylglutathione lyase
MKLGHCAFVTLYSSSPEKTKTFCDMLGFTAVSSETDAALMTDGNYFFDIRYADTSATTLSYCVSDISNAIHMAENLEIAIAEKSQHHAILQEPNGLLILLISSEVLALSEFPKKPSSFCGTFYEMSLETTDMERSISWWQNVGFKATARQKTWCTLDDGKMKIGLYEKGSCPHAFRNPSLTYFESDMAKRIEQLKQRGIPFVQGEGEIGMKGHAIAESPEGQYFFLFTA